MASEINSFKKQIASWVSETFEREDFYKIDFELSGASEKGEGYIGDLAFVKVKALTLNKETIYFDLVIKYGKLDNNVREKFPVRLAFEREIYIYGKAVPVFQKFEENRNMKILDIFLPKCYGTILNQTQEVIVFQNLKSICYELYDRFQPLDLNHLRLTFENYGKWHGLSIAYRDQNRSHFNSLFKNLECWWQAFLPTIEDCIKITEETIYALLKNNNKFGLIEKLQRRFQQGFVQTFLDILKTEEGNSVLLHGDCWNNNMMFLYDDPDKVHPKAMKFLDFQLSKLGSPVLDLSYHLYSTASAKELEHFRELLRIYHSSLSSTVQQLGSDSEKLFPYSELVRQWKKYSGFGLVLGPYLVLFAVSDKEDTIDLHEINGEVFRELLKKLMEKRGDLITSRIIAAVEHVLEFDGF